LFRKGTFGDGLSRPHAGSRRAPARRPSSFGVELNRDHLFEAGHLVRRAPAEQLAAACVQVRGKLDVRDRGKVTAASVRSAALEVGADARVTGAVQVLGDGSLRSRARVEGDLSLGGSVGLDRTATITGKLKQGTPLLPIASSSRSVSAGTTPVTVPNDQSRSLAPGNYGALLLRARGTLRLSAGTYNLASFSMEDATLALDTSGGAIQINVQGALGFGDRARLTKSGSQKVQFYTNATGTVRVGTDVTTFGASLTAPAGQVSISSRSVVTGCVAAKRLTVEPDARVSQP